MSSPMELPPGWERRRTTAGDVFYIDHNTRKTQWTPPNRLRSNRNGSPKTSNSQQWQGDLGPLPANWEVRIFGDGRKFFINHNTKSTQWEDPRLIQKQKQAAAVMPDYKLKIENLRKQLAAKKTEVRKRDPEWIQLEEEYRRHRHEHGKLRKEVDKLEKRKKEAKDDDKIREVQQKLELKSLEKDVAFAKQKKAYYQRDQRSHELERDLLVQELKGAANDELKRAIQVRLEKAEREIQYYKRKVNKYESDANHRLGLLKEESHRILEDSLKLGYLLLELFTCIMVGPPGVGKTLLKHLLLGKKPPLTRTSTPCAEQPIKIRSVSLSKFQKLLGRWKEVSEEQLLPMIGRYIRQNAERLRMIIPDEIKEYLDLLEMSPATSAVASEKVATSSMATASSGDPSTTVVGMASSSLPSDSETQSPSSSDEAAALKEMIDSVFGTLEKLISGEELSEEEAEELLSSIWVYFTDCGGQPQFHELLPLFIREVSSVVFVSRLSDRLDDRPPDEFYKDGGLVGKRSCTHLTIENQVQCLTRSLLSHSSSSQPPSIIMVGTHLDQADKCSETIDEKNEKLIKMFGPELQKHLIFYKPFKKLLFPVNSLTPGKSDFNVAKSVQEGVESSVAKKVKVPIWWFILELLIQGLAGKLKKRVLSRKLCVGIAQALGITEREFDAALYFFDELNVIKYSPVLPEVVFVDSQVPLDNLSDLVQEGYLLRHGQSSARKGNWKQFCDEGIVTIDYLDSTCKHFETGIFESRELLKLLESKLVVVPLKLSAEGMMEYFLPALLDILSRDELEKHRVFSSTAAPLLFRFSHGCRRAGVFCCLTVYLMKECKWSILSKNGELMLVARNCVTFSLPTCACIVTLIDAFYYLEAHITKSTPSICRKACPTIQKEVLAGINAACEKLLYTDDHPHLAVFCQHPGSTASPPSHEDRHAAVIDIENNCCECTKGQEVTELQEQHTIWLTDAACTDQDEPSSTTSDTSACTCPLDAQPSIAKLSLLKTPDKKKIKIITRLAPYWRKMGLLMDFDDSGTQLDIIDTKHHGDPEACCEAMFQHWLKGNGVKPCSWRKLIELIDDCDQEVLAQDIQSALSALASNN